MYALPKATFYSYITQLQNQQLTRLQNAMRNVCFFSVILQFIIKFSPIRVAQKSRRSLCDPQHAVTCPPPLSFTPCHIMLHLNLFLQERRTLWYRRISDRDTFTSWEASEYSLLISWMDVASCWKLTALLYVIYTYIYIYIYDLMNLVDLRRFLIIMYEEQERFKLITVVFLKMMDGNSS